MGTATNQIATQTNVNSKRVGSFTASKHCPKKSQIESVEFLQVNNKSTVTSANIGSMASPRISSTYPYHWISGITTGYATCNGFNTAQACYSNFKSGEYALTTVNMSITVSSQSSYVTYKYKGLNSSNGNFIYNYSFAKYVLTTNSDTKHCSISLFAKPQGGYSSSVPTSSTISSGVTTSSGSCAFNGILHIHILDSSYNILKTTSLSNIDYGKNTIIDWSANANSTYYVCLCPSGDFKVSNLSSGTYVLWFGLRSYLTLTKYSKYYDSGDKCVQFDDIAEKSSRSFTVYYGIYNNKSSSAKLNSIEAFIGNSSNRNTGTWTKIGTKSLGNISSTTTGSFICTIPSTISLSSTKYLSFYCGATDRNQNWYYVSGGNSSNIKNIANWTSIGKVTSYNTPGVGLQSSILSSPSNSSVTKKFRSSSNAILFKIQ